MRVGNLKRKKERKKEREKKKSLTDVAIVFELFVLSLLSCDLSIPSVSYRVHLIASKMCKSSAQEFWVCTRVVSTTVQVVFCWQPSRRQHPVSLSGIGCQVSTFRLRCEVANLRKACVAS
jgi:hypothetical protein